MAKDKIRIELSLSEALVLFEFVSRFSQKGKLEIMDQAEERILWDVCSSLENALAEPFLENYSELLARARKEVRDKDT